VKKDFNKIKNKILDQDHILLKRNHRAIIQVFSLIQVNLVLKVGIKISILPDQGLISLVLEYR